MEDDQKPFSVRPLGVFSDVSSWWDTEDQAKREASRLNKEARSDGNDARYVACDNEFLKGQGHA